MPESQKTQIALGLIGLVGALGAAAIANWGELAGKKETPKAPIEVQPDSMERSFLCKFTFGPRAGQVQDYTGHPLGPLPVGSPCQDGIASTGFIISSRR